MTDEGKRKAWKPDLSKVRKIGDPPERSPEEVKLMEALAKEHSDLRDARLGVLDSWNLVEGALAELLRTVVGTHDPILASILYFSPHSFRTRLDTISKLIEHLVVSGVKDPDLKKNWDRVAEKLRKKKNIRNLAAHGNIITYADPSGKNTPLIAPVMMQMDAYLNAYRSGKLPGASLTEARQFIQTAERLRIEVDAYHQRLKTVLGIR